MTLAETGVLLDLTDVDGGTVLFEGLESIPAVEDLLFIV